MKKDKTLLQIDLKHTNMRNDLKENLKKEARFLHITIPYDKDDRMITFDDSVMIELECDGIYHK